MVLIQILVLSLATGALGKIKFLYQLGCFQKLPSNSLKSSEIYCRTTNSELRKALGLVSSVAQFLALSASLNKASPNSLLAPTSAWTPASWSVPYSTVF
jgi:hypothetical protein